MTKKLGGKFVSEMAYEIKEAGALFYALDKGNKRGVQHVVKYACIWSKKERRVETPLLDIDTDGGTSVKATAAMDVSMKKNWHTFHFSPVEV